MASLFYPFAQPNGSNGHGHEHGRTVPSGAHPLWAMSMFGEEQPRIYSVHPGSRIQARSGPQAAATVPVCDPEELLTTAASLASAFLPAYFDLVGGTRTRTAMKESQLAPIKNAFEVKVNVSEYSPAELSVRTVGNTILVEGKHTEREDELGFVSRSFSRRFVIPEDVKAENVTCKLTSDGFLVLSAPVVVVPPVTNERTVPIILSNAPAVVPTTLDPVPQEKEGEVKPSVPEKENPVLIENIGDEDTKGSAEEGAKPA